MTSPKIVHKRATYECGCAIGLNGPQGEDPRPPMQCPEHNAEWVNLETLDLPSPEDVHGILKGYEIDS